MEYYFAYGSNMSKERMKDRGVKSTKRVSWILPWYKLIFQEFSTVSCVYSNITPSTKNSVEWIVYEVNDTIKNLDLYEHVGVNYFKEKRIIKTDKWDVECIVYIWNPEFIWKNKSPKKKFLNNLLEWKKYLSKEYYSKLKNTLK